MKHIIFIGFKHAGKSMFGEMLAEKTGLPFFDLDDLIVKKEAKKTGEKMSCGEIVRGKGEEYFRDIETECLKEIVGRKGQVVLSLGGGALAREENQKLLFGNDIVYLSVPKSILYERIMTGGKPSFFDEEKSAYENFEDLWTARVPVYEKMATITVENKAAQAETFTVLMRELGIFNLVIGGQLGHSLSPEFHEKIYAKLGVHARMISFETDSCEAAIQKIHELNAELSAITIPHKEAIMEFLDEIDGEALEIGAVNTVIQTAGVGDCQARLKGFNTDITGIEKAFENEGVSVKGKRLMLLGAGGAARAVAFFAKKHGAKLLCTNRNASRAAELAKRMGGQVIPWEDREKIEADIYVNATPLGMEPNENETPISAKVFTPQKVAFDVVYAPQETVFLKNAKSHGAKIIYGIQMFEAQALAQIDLWLKSKNINS